MKPSAKATLARVEKHRVSRLVDALDIPAVFKCQQGTVCEKD